MWDRLHTLHTSYVNSHKILTLLHVLRKWNRKLSMAKIIDEIMGIVKFDIS